MGESISKTEDGRTKIHVTNKPADTITVFTGAGDSETEIGEGNRLIFKLLASDTSQTIDLTFNDVVWIKDGLLISENAPFGSYVNIEIVHPLTQQTLMHFAKKMPMLGSNWNVLDTDDSARLEQGLILRITVHNASGIGNESPPCDFNVVGRIELFRTL